MSFSQDFELIRKDRMGVVNSSVYPGLKTLVSQIYPDEAHFIYELLQNAEDAQATKVEFSIRKSKLVFAHNGSRQFDADDVEAITNIAHSTKKIIMFRLESSVLDLSLYMHLQIHRPYTVIQFVLR